MPALPALPKVVCRLFERGLGHFIKFTVSHGGGVLPVNHLDLANPLELSNYSWEYSDSTGGIFNRTGQFSRKERDEIRIREYNAARSALDPIGLVNK
jgi:hypothetical protein